MRNKSKSPKEPKEPTKPKKPKEPKEPTKPKKPTKPKEYKELATLFNSVLPSSVEHQRTSSSSNKSQRTSPTRVEHQSTSSSSNKSQRTSPSSVEVIRPIVLHNIRRHPKDNLIKIEEITQQINKGFKN
jgi:hypothetical protein